MKKRRKKSQLLSFNERNYHPEKHLADGRTTVRTSVVNHNARDVQPIRDCMIQIMNKAGGIQTHPPKNSSSITRMQAKIFQSRTGQWPRLESLSSQKGLLKQSYQKNLKILPTVR